MLISCSVAAKRLRLAFTSDFQPYRAHISRIAKVCSRKNSGGERSGRITHTFCHSAPWCTVWRWPSVNTAVCDFSCQLLICECVFVFTSGCEEKIPHRLFSRIKGYSPTLISCATGPVLMCLRFRGLFRREERFWRYSLLLRVFVCVRLKPLAVKSCLIFEALYLIKAECVNLSPLLSGNDVQDWVSWWWLSRVSVARVAGPVWSSAGFLRAVDGRRKRRSPSFCWFEALNELGAKLMLAECVCVHIYINTTLSVDRQLLIMKTPFLSTLVLVSRAHRQRQFRSIGMLIRSAGHSFHWLGFSQSPASFILLKLFCCNTSLCKALNNTQLFLFWFSGKWKQRVGGVNT